MSITSLINLFLHPDRFTHKEKLRKSKLFVKACLLTSMFSSSYIGFSLLFEYELGAWLMVYNAVGFVVLALFAKTKVPISVLGNIYVFVGGSAVTILAYFSGGIWSALYPWIISIPVLALLVVGRNAAIFWGVISFLVMLWLGILAEQGIELPVQYNQEYKTLWFLSVVPGLLLIILFISFVFEYTQTKALQDLEENNAQLLEQKDTIAIQAERLKELLKEKDYIIRILAHDLRSPLNNITSLVSLMSIESEQERMNEYNKLILTASENAMNLVNRVLEMDASNQEQVQLKLKDIEVDKYLIEVIENLKDTATAKRILIDFITETKGVKVAADNTYFKLIFENLISNAIKFSDQGKKVTIKTLLTGKNIQVRVIDEGPGVSKSDQKMLFQKFTKLSARPTAGEGSIGLGLSLVKRYVELINGEVYYEDIENQGAIFIVKLPIS